MVCVCVRSLYTIKLFFLIVCFCVDKQKVNTKTGEVSDTPVGMMDVYQEFNELSEKFRIMKFKSKVGADLGYGLYSMNVIFWQMASFVVSN